MSPCRKPRTVLMLVENRPAPSDARVWPEALALREAGFRVCVISPKGGAYQEPYAHIDDIHVYRYRTPVGDTLVGYCAEYGTALLMTFWFSLKVWRRHRFDVIHAANPPDIFFPLAWFYRLFGTKFVFDQHDLAPETFQARFERRIGGRVSKLVRALLVFLERCSYRAAELVIVTNESFRRIALNRGGCPARKVVIVRNGPDVKRMRPVNPVPELKMGRRYLLTYVGEMAAQDGVEYALHALDALVHRRGRDDVALALIGDGASAGALRELAHDLQLDDYVTFTGWLSPAEVARYLSVADVGLSPEPRNAMNDASTMIKVMEYMAMGKPIVAFDLRETRFSAQEAALYATPNSVEDFATKIQDVLDDEALRRRMGAFGPKRIAEALSWGHSREQLLQAYDKLFQDGTVLQEAKRGSQELSP